MQENREEISNNKLGDQCEKKYEKNIKKKKQHIINLVINMNTLQKDKKEKIENGEKIYKK